MPGNTIHSSPPFPSYFTCTLGHAKILNDTLGPAPYQNFAEFLDYLADRFGEDVAIACTNPNEDRVWVVEGLTFSEVHKVSRVAAGWIRQKLGYLQAPPTIAIYASSSLSYLVHLLACLWSGYKVALISTACSNDAVRHLLKACAATAILVDTKHEDSVTKILAAESGVASTSVKKLLLQHRSMEELIHCKEESELQSQNAPYETDQIILYGHSSGTSTGLPKPIPITYQNEIGALPRFHQANDYSRPNATLSTTPIYTGGLADLWRSWSAGTALWTYPEHQVPITAQNLLNYKTAAEEWTHLRTGIISSIGHVSCVPYVLQMMAEDKLLIRWLQSMEIVGVGGAAMPTTLGDELVSNDVNLISRYGSRECGFLLSSERDFSHDKDWQYVRHDKRVDSITFKKWNDTDFELIVSDNWPSLSPAIKDKLPYNSHDVFVPHPDVRDAWKYNGRSDVQITLRTGKKFDPAGIESALASSVWIKDAVVVGNNQILPAAIIFSSPEAENLDKVNCEEKIWLAVSELNIKCPTHARLRRDMIAILPSNESSRIVKSSKGTIMRGKFDESFNDVVHGLYNGEEQDSSLPNLNTLDEDERVKEISSMIKNQLGIEVPDPDTSFYDAGVDSTMSMQVRRQIQARLPQNLRNTLPVNVLYDTGSVRKLSTYVGNLEKTLADDSLARVDGEDCEKEIQQFLAQVQIGYDETEGEWKEFRHASDGIERQVDEDNVILLTGATGFLGAHLLAELVYDEKIKKVICLVRPSTKDNGAESARNRVAQALAMYSVELSDDQWNKVDCLYASLHESGLGLGSESFQYVIKKTTQIVHAAWAVNFSLSLEAYLNQLKGFLNLYNVTRAARGSGKPISFAFVSSTAAVLSAPQPILEVPSSNPREASSTGYGKSKWAAEKLLHDLSNEIRSSDITILRVGQLTASRQSGAWNLQEAWPLMLDAGFRLLCRNGRAVLPDLSRMAGNELDWLPVNSAARAIKEIVIGPPQSASEGKPKVFHILSNPDSNFTWAEVKEWLTGPVKIDHAERQQQCHVDFIPIKEWLDQLEDAGHYAKRHLAISLLPLWRSGWSEQESVNSRIRFSTTSSQQASETMRLVAAGKDIVTKEDFLRMLGWILSPH